MAYRKRKTSYRTRSSRSGYKSRRKTGKRRASAPQRIVIQVIGGHPGGMSPIAVTAGKKAPMMLRPRF